MAGACAGARKRTDADEHVKAFHFETVDTPGGGSHEAVRLRGRISQIARECICNLNTAFVV